MILSKALDHIAKAKCAYNHKKFYEDYCYTCHYDRFVPADFFSSTKVTVNG